MIYSSALWSWHLENQLTGHRIVLFRNPACDSRSDMAGWFFKITSDCLSLSPQEAKPWEEAPPPCPLSLFANWTCTKLDIKSSTGFKCLFESLMLLYPSLQRRQCHPTPVLFPGESHGRRSLVGCSPWGHEESDTTERFHFHFSLACNGEGNGNPLQCSCLENPRDGAAWWATVYGVAQSQTQLKRLSSSSSSILHWHHVPFFTLAAF